jgi:hypothetical protein
VPIRYEIDPEKRLVVTTVTGSVSVAQMLEYQRTLASDPRYRPDFRALSDYTQAEPFKATGDDIWRLAEAMPVAQGARRAMLVASDLHYGLGRIAQSVSERPGVAVAVFRDRAEAMAWLDAEAS